MHRRGRLLARVDAYELTTLRPWHAVKRRNGSIIECKQRVGPVEEVAIAGVVGFAERWVKQRPGSWRQPAVWVELAKQRWRDGAVEITHITTSSLRAWSVCVDLTKPLSWNDMTILERWADVLVDRGVAASYPAWLGDHVRHHTAYPRPSRVDKPSD